MGTPTLKSKSIFNMILFVIALIGAAAAGPTNEESLRVSLSQKALDFAEDVAFTMIDIIQKVASGTLALPDINDSSFKASNMKLANLNLGKPEISIVPGTGIKWRNGQAAIKVTGKWAAKAGWWWIDGDMTLDANMAVDATAGITAKNGKLATASKGCTLHFNSFNLDLHNALYNWVASLAQGYITPEIRSAVCNEVNKVLDTTVNGIVATLPHNIPVADIMDVEIEADSDPSFTATELDIHARVKADSQGADTVFPFQPEGISSQMDPSYMACLLISDYSLNTASYLAVGAGKITESLPNAEIPATDEIMDTLYFKDTIPELYNTYPDKAMGYQIRNTRYPRVEFDHDNIIIDMPLDLTVKVEGAEVAVLAVALTVEGTLQHSNNVLSGSITSATHTTSVKSTQIGNIDSQKIANVISDILQNTAVPRLNAVFNKGVTLPIDQYVNLNKGLVEARNDFVKVCADATLTDFSIAELKRIAQEIINNM